MVELYRLALKTTSVGRADPPFRAHDSWQSRHGQCLRAILGCFQIWHVPGSFFFQNLIYEQRVQMCPKRFVMKAWNLVINNVDWWCILICSLTPSIRLSGCPLGKLASLQDWINHCSSWMWLRCASRGAEGKSKRKNVGQHGGSIRTALSGCAFSCQGSHSGGNAFANPCRGGLPFLQLFHNWSV